MTFPFRLAALALLVHGACHAATAGTDTVLAALKQKYPGTAFTSVSPAPVKGLYEVVMGRKIAYTDSTGRYFMYGSLVDMKTKADLTAARRDDLMRVDAHKLPLKDAIVRVNGKGRRTLYVFSDPDCPFCRRLEPELDKLDDVTIYLFLYPIESLHSDAARKAQAIWCEGDEKKRLDLWHRVVLRTDNVATAECENPLKRNLALGDSLGLQGTPTLIAADGRTLPGMVPAANIEEWLSPKKVVASMPSTH
ncbi:MAG: DsbC family protein [Burkholderiaceae bacterium]